MTSIDLILSELAFQLLMSTEPRRAHVCVHMKQTKCTGKIYVLRQDTLQTSQVSFKSIK